MIKQEQCLGCFSQQTDAEVCPECGFDKKGALSSPFHLPPGTILENKYLIGRVLGQGGFGITYLAWDINLKVKLAIKEFFPQELASRSAGQSWIIAYTGTSKEDYNYGINKFLQEAQTLAQFEGHPNIVSVRDFFKANGTAYLVMSYVEGITLKSHLASSGGRMTFKQANAIIMPVLDALREVHAVGILHRDISPDNIFINTNGRVILLDFGAARQALSEHGQSLSIILKPGYAPEEQYRTRGEQGPWTDIYATAATFYHLLTGKQPHEALERLIDDHLEAPSTLGAELSPYQEQTLLKALAVRGRHRYQKVEDFQTDLLRSGPPATTPPAQGGYAPPPGPPASGMAHGSMPDNMAPAPKKKSSGLKIAAIIGGSVLVLFVIMIVVILAGVRSTLRSSEVYSQSIAGLLSNSQAVALLGEPVEAGKAVNGEINVNNGSGNAELSIPVSGSISKGDLQSRGLRTDGQWSLTLLELVMENGERINLLADLSQGGQNEQALGQADLGAGSGSTEDEDLPPRQAGGGSASNVTGMLSFNEPGFGFTMDYPEDWDYYIDESTISFESPSGTLAEELYVLVQILGNSSIGGEYANLDEVYAALESLYSSLDGELFDSERGTDYIGSTMHDYVWTGAIYNFEGKEYLEMAIVYQRDSEYFYLLMYTIPLDAEEDFIDLVFDEMFESFRFVAF